MVDSPTIQAVAWDATQYLMRTTMEVLWNVRLSYFLRWGFAARLLTETAGLSGPYTPP